MSGVRRDQLEIIRRRTIVAGSRARGGYSSHSCRRRKPASRSARLPSVPGPAGRRQARQEAAYRAERTRPPMAAPSPAASDTHWLGFVSRSRHCAARSQPRALGATRRSRQPKHPVELGGGAQRLKPVMRRIGLDRPGPSASAIRHLSAMGAARGPPAATPSPKSLDDAITSPPRTGTPWRIQQSAIAQAPEAGGSWGWQRRQREQREEPAVDGGRLDHRGELLPPRRSRSAPPSPAAAGRCRRRRHDRPGSMPLLPDEVLQASCRDAGPGRVQPGMASSRSWAPVTEDEAACRQDGRTRAVRNKADDAVFAERPDRGLPASSTAGIAGDAEQRLGPLLVLVEDRRCLAAELTRDLPEAPLPQPGCRLSSRRVTLVPRRPRPRPCRLRGPPAPRRQSTISDRPRCSAASPLTRRRPRLSAGSKASMGRSVRPRG